MFPHTSQKTSRRDVEAPETLESLGSFKVSASVSEAAMSRLSLGQNFECLGLGDMGLGSRFSLGSEGLVDIPVINLQKTGPQAIV